MTNHDLSQEEERPFDRSELIAFLMEEEGVDLDSAPTIQRHEFSEYAPLSFAQHRLWVLHELHPNDPAYNIPAALLLKGAFNVEALKKAFQQIVLRHETLRTTFPTKNDEPIQLISDSVSFHLDYHDLSDFSELNRESEMKRLAEENMLRPFDFTKGPLMRVALLQLDKSEHALLLTMHHIISDGWSMGVLVDEFTQFYSDFAFGREHSVPELSIQYADFSQWQRDRLGDGTFDAQINYWKNQLRGLPALIELPTDRPRPPVQTFKGSIYQFPVDEITLERVKSLSLKYDCTLFMALLSVFGVLLSKYSRQKDIAVGSPIANRNYEQTEPLIGFFVNTLVFRLNLDDNPTFDALLARIKDTSLDAYANQDAPFEQLVEELNPPRNLSHSPLFQVMFVLQNAAMKELTLPDLIVSPIEQAHVTSKFDLTLLFEEEDRRLNGTIEYNTDLFDAETVQRMANHYLQLLSLAIDDPSKTIDSYSILTDRELKQLSEWNNTQKDYNERRLIQEIIEQQANERSNAVALVYEGRSLSYDELNRKANRLAHYLIDNGVGPDCLVGICLERSFEMVVGLLAVLKAGGAYVPLDPEYPQERLRSMLQDASISVLLTQHRIIERRILPDESIPECILQLDLDFDSIVCKGVYSEDNPRCSVKDDNLAYVIFTSGSTGKPKGVAIEHEAIRNRLLWMQERYCLTPDDCVLQKTPFSFDVSVWEFFWPLMYGARLAVAKPGGHRDGVYLVDTIEKANVTTLHFVPSMLQVFLEEPNLDACTSLMRVFCSGEALSYEQKEKFLHRFQRVELHNLYGPTEAAVDVTFWHCTPNYFRNIVPIGRPIANTQMHVLDESLQPVPIGVGGELHIGGVNLARGYLNRPDLTADKFIANPYTSEDSNRCGRLYKTGDLARWLPDGNIEYMGRIDNQVKIRGLRIELGEIESALMQYESIKEAAVSVFENPPGHKHLVAYIVFNVESQTSDKQATNNLYASLGEDFVKPLRVFLQEKLPEYMVPALFIQINSLPLSSNGKLDRRSLPDPKAFISDRSKKYVGPRNEEEKILADIWRELLHLERVGVHDNFFELGGDSILNIQAVSRARKAGIQLAPTMIFQYQTIAELASAAEPTLNVLIEQGTVTGTLPLTPIQNWFFEMELDEPHHFNQATLFEISSEVSDEILQKALDAVLTHHDALRIRFEKQNEIWTQVIGGSIQTPLVETVDLSMVSNGDFKDVLQLQIDSVHAQLRLDRTPLLRVVRFRCGQKRSDRLLIVIHHLVVDAVSWTILLDDLMSCYMQIENGHSPSLPQKTSSFKQWANRLLEASRSDLFDEDARYWNDRPWDCIQPLPVDSMRPSEENTVALSETIVVALDRERTQQLLSDVHAACNTQISDVLLTALATGLEEWSGGSCISVDLEGHGRELLFEDIDLSRTVGWFTTVFPIFLDFNGKDDALNRLKSIKERLRGIPHKGLGFGVLYYLKRDGNLRKAPRSEILFNYLGQIDSAIGDSKLFRPAKESSGATQSPTNRRRYSIEIVCYVEDGSLKIHWTYCSLIHNQNTIETLAKRFIEALIELIRVCLLPSVCTYTPSDFPNVNLTQECLNRLQKTFVRENLPNNIEGIYPLSPSQKGMLIETLARTDLPMHIEQRVWDIKGALNRDAFLESWRFVVCRHSILRTAFFWEDLEEPIQIVFKNVDIPYLYRDLRAQSEAERIEDLEEYIRDDARKAFPLKSAPLMRLALFQTQEDAYRLVWSHHHILMDGWCNALLQQELLTVYSALNDGCAPILSPVLQYHDYLSWLGKQDKEKAESFWKKTMKGFVQPNSIGVELGSFDTSQQEFRRERRAAGLTQDETEGLREFAMKNHVTLNSVAQGVWALILSRYSGERDVIFGATSSGRPPDIPGIESSLGLFINTIPLRYRIEPCEAFGQWLKDCQVSQRDCYTYGFCSAGQIQNWSEIQGGKSLYDSIVVFQNYPGDAPASRFLDVEFDIEERESSGAITHHPLVFLLSSAPEMEIQVVFDCNCFKEGDIERLLNHFLMLLRKIVESGAADVQSLIDIIPDDEIPEYRKQVSRKSDCVAPRNPLEMRLVKIWESVLNYRPIGVTDNFFEIGGHSLLALPLLSKVQREMGVHISLNSLLQCGTIEQLAVNVRKDKAASVFSSLVEIHPLKNESGKIPIFCVHPGGGTVFCYYDLARHLGEEQPFYAFQAFGTEEGQVPFDCVEDMAQNYLREFDSVYPSGSVVLAGWSFGGIVAFEMAQQLLERNRDVAALCLIDIHAPNTLSDEIWNKDSAELLVEIFGQDFSLSIEPLRTLNLQEQLVYVTEKAKDAKVFPPDFEGKDALRMWNVFMANRKAEQTYAPKPYNHPIVLLKSSVRECETDESMGWKSLARKGISTYSISGNHQEILREPNVRYLAKLFKACLVNKLIS